MNSHSKIQVITRMLEYAELMLLYLQGQQQTFNTVFDDLRRHLHEGYDEFDPATFIGQLDTCLTNITLLLTCLWEWYLAATPLQDTTHDCSTCGCSSCILTIIERLLEDFIGIREEPKWWLEGESPPDPQDIVFWYNLQESLDSWKTLLYRLNHIADLMFKESQRVGSSSAIFIDGDYSSLIQELTDKFRETRNPELGQEEEEEISNVLELTDKFQETHNPELGQEEEEISNVVSPFETPNRYAVLVGLGD